MMWPYHVGYIKNILQPFLANKDKPYRCALPCQLKLPLLYAPVLEQAERAWDSSEM